MTVTIDVSMYPNREDFIPPIDGFIERIKRYDDLKVTVFPTSTVVQGEYEAAGRAILDTIRACHDEFGQAVYVTKIIPGYEAL